MPKSPVSRTQVDAFGRTAAKATVTTASAIATAIAGIARFAARVVTQIWRAIEAVPAALQVLAVVAILMLLGIVGSIAATGTLALICSVVVVPVCSSPSVRSDTAGSARLLPSPRRPGPICPARSSTSTRS